jgi:transcriptional regulator with XRE-family HTH domain
MNSLVSAQTWRPGTPAWITALREERVQRGLTQEQLADALGVKVSAIKSLESGDARIYPRLAARWAAALDHTITAAPNTTTPEEAL